MFTVLVQHGDSTTPSDSYVQAEAETRDVAVRICKAIPNNGDGWNSYAWVEDENDDCVFDRDHYEEK